MMVFEDIQKFSLSLEGTEMDDPVFECFQDIIINMNNLKNLKLNINKCNITPELFYEFSMKIADLTTLDGIEIIARKNYWEVKKREIVYDGFNGLTNVENKKLDF